MMVRGGRTLSIFTHLSWTVAITVCWSGQLVAEDWSWWRGPDRNGVSQEVDWNHEWPGVGPDAVWNSDVGTGFSSVVVSDGRLFTSGNTDDVDTLFCLDSKTGVRIWKHSRPCPLDDHFFEGGPTSTPTVDGASVFCLSRTGDMTSLDAKTGDVRWTKNLPNEMGAEVPGWGFAGSPLVLGDLVIVSVGQSGTALNKLTGDVVWQSEGEAGYMTPLPIPRDGAQSVVIASGKFFYEVDALTGTVKWQHRWLTTFGCNAADPIWDHGRLFISSGYNRGAALLVLSDDAAKVVWDSKDFQNQWSSSVLVDGFLYGVDGNDTSERYLRCIEIETGKVRWSYEGLGSASLLSAGNRLIILSDQGELVVAPASPEEFKPLARAQVLMGKCWTVPVLANGLLYCRNAVGELVCLDLRKP